ncbi:MAG: toprim domain-containing protein [Cyclobacteriaceae bacterium]
MNIDKAKNIPLQQLAHHLGFTLDPKKSRLDDLWFFSPFRKERTASFHIHAKKNIWYDFGEGMGGDIIDLICQLRHTTTAEALQWLSGQALGAGEEKNHPSHQPPLKPTPEASSEKTTMAHINPKVGHPALLEYLQARGIDVHGKGSELLQEIYYKKDDKTSFGLGVENHRGGYEIRNKYQKFTLGAKSYRLIPSATDTPLTGIFEGFLDYISALQLGLIEEGERHIFILNSTAMVSQVLQRIEDEFFHCAQHLFLDNDETGTKTTRQLIDSFQQQGIRYLDCRGLYKKYNDINAMLQARRTKA